MFPKRKGSEEKQKQLNNREDSGIGSMREGMRGSQPTNGSLRGPPHKPLVVSTGARAWQLNLEAWARVASTRLKICVAGKPLPRPSSTVVGRGLKWRDWLTR